MRQKPEVSLLRTKLYRPQLPADLVQRDDLIAKLEAGRRLPLTLDARLFQGLAHYHWNQLESAEAALKPVVDHPTSQHVNGKLQGAMMLSLVYQAQGRSEAAQELLGSTISTCLVNGLTPHLPELQAMQADLALRQGRLSEAVQWAKTYDTSRAVFTPHHFFLPQLIYARVLLSQATTSSVAQAHTLLAKWRGDFELAHNTRFLIEVLGLQAWCNEAQGNKASATAALAQAINLAQPGGFIRLFADMGPRLATLLDGLELDAETGCFVDQIRAVCQHESPLRARLETSLRSSSNGCHMTPRELDVLELLGQRLSDKEIAATLFISPKTVKRHTNHIYGKLDVNDRREAVTKAKTLGLVST